MDGGGRRRVAGDCAAHGNRERGKHVVLAALLERPRHGCESHEGATVGVGAGERRHAGGEEAVGHGERVGVRRRQAREHVARRRSDGGDGPQVGAKGLRQRLDQRRHVLDDGVQQVGFRDDAAEHGACVLVVRTPGAQPLAALVSKRHSDLRGGTAHGGGRQHGAHGGRYLLHLLVRVRQLQGVPEGPVYAQDVVLHDGRLVHHHRPLRQHVQDRLARRHARTPVVLRARPRQLLQLPRRHAQRTPQLLAGAGGCLPEHDLSQLRAALLHVHQQTLRRVDDPRLRAPGAAGARRAAATSRTRSRAAQTRRQRRAGAADGAHALERQRAAAAGWVQVGQRPARQHATHCRTRLLTLPPLSSQRNQTTTTTTKGDWLGSHPWLYASSLLPTECGNE
eukprot:Rhum_TRINITY_DN14788_c15_g1::Rhum_TRINITY_DN14788_c15_g1_i1::g.119118::m.119118